MRKLLFNGCSFTAGDELVWHLYRPDVQWRGAGWQELYNKYCADFRSLHNLAFKTAEALGCTRHDLSKDGNTNGMIATDTINWLLSKSPEERTQYHVCVGWTSPSRYSKWVKSYTQFYNIHVHHVTSINSVDTVIQNELGDSICLRFIHDYDHDWLLDYIKNLMLLENFLIANGITYTFWRSIDGGAAEEEVFRLLHNASVPVYNASLAHNWVNFQTVEHPWLSPSWCTTILSGDESNWLSSTNSHPSLKAITEFVNNRLIPQIGKNLSM